MAQLNTIESHQIKVIFIISVGEHSAWKHPTGLAQLYFFSKHRLRRLLLFSSFSNSNIDYSRWGAVEVLRVRMNL